MLIFKSQEADAEMERLRSANAQSERTLEARERSHRQRIRGLEEQVFFVFGVKPSKRYHIFDISLTFDGAIGSHIIIA